MGTDVAELATTEDDALGLIDDFLRARGFTRAADTLKSELDSRPVDSTEGVTRLELLLGAGKAAKSPPQTLASPPSDHLRSTPPTATADISTPEKTKTHFAASAAKPDGRILPSPAVHAGAVWDPEVHVGFVDDSTKPEGRILPSPPIAKAHMPVHFDGEESPVEIAAAEPRGRANRGTAAATGASAAPDKCDELLSAGSSPDDYNALEHADEDQAETEDHDKTEDARSAAQKLPKPIAWDSDHDEYSHDEDVGYTRIPMGAEDFFLSAEEFVQQHQALMLKHELLEDFRYATELGRDDLNPVIERFENLSVGAHPLAKPPKPIPTDEELLAMLDAKPAPNKSAGPPAPPSEDAEPKTPSSADDGNDTEPEPEGTAAPGAESVEAEGLDSYNLKSMMLRYMEAGQFDSFDLRVIFERNRTGFEESKDFPIEINGTQVIAGQYQVIEYLGSAAFSKAVQCIDLRDGSHVCIKIIKNNKDFFDQSLDEIKLLKYLNAHDRDDSHHIVQLYEYFYHKEHLFIVCELLRDNLYEFSKFNRESGGANYFNLARLQRITKQCLHALAFIHSLFLIHCDLKPENILIKSYSRCEVKIIDFGSSCFITDHLSSYVQSRSYRAPEVILGMPYDQKIDIWSLGCILAELFTGNVLFQNDSVQTLLVRIVGILGPFDPAYLERGRYMHKFFTKDYTIYEKRPEGEGFYYIAPKRSSLKSRLGTDDQNFVDFVGWLLKVKPEERPTAQEAMDHPWLTQSVYDWPE